MLLNYSALLKRADRMTDFFVYSIFIPNNSYNDVVIQQCWINKKDTLDEGVSFNMISNSFDSASRITLYRFLLDEPLNTVLFVVRFLFSSLLCLAGKACI